MSLGELQRTTLPEAQMDLVKVWAWDKLRRIEREKSMFFHGKWGHAKAYATFFLSRGI